MGFKKSLKITVNVFLVVILIIVLLPILLLVIAKLSENRIATLALDYVGKEIGAPATVSNVSVRLLRNWPSVTVEIDDLAVGRSTAAGRQLAAVLPNDGCDTLTSLRKIFLSVKAKPLADGKIEVDAIEIDGLTLCYEVDSAGGTNIDFLLAADTTSTPVVFEVEDTQVDTAPALLDVLLRNLTLTDITVRYNDAQMKAQAIVQVPKVQLSARVEGEKYKGQAAGGVVLSRLAFENYNLAALGDIKLDFDAAYDDGQAHIASMQLAANGLSFNVDGDARLGDSIFVDMRAKMPRADIAQLVKVLPAAMLAEFGVTQVAGVASLEAEAKGYYFGDQLLPAVTCALRFDDGRVVTTDYPTITHLSLAGTANVPNAYNLATVTVQLPSLRLATENSAVELEASVNDLEHPEYEVKTRIVLHLDEFAGLIPPGTLESLSGDLEIAFQTQGKLPEELGVATADHFLKSMLIDLNARNIEVGLDPATTIAGINATVHYTPDRRLRVNGLSLNAPAFGARLENALFDARLLGSTADIDNMGVKVDTFRVAMGQTSMAGRLKAKGLQRPDFDVDSRIDVLISDIGHFIPDSLVDAISGTASLRIASRGQIDLDSIEQQIMPIVFEQSKFDLSVRDFNFDLFDDTLVVVNNLGLDMAMANDTLRLDHLSGTAMGIDFGIDSTEVWNVYKAFLLQQPEQKLIVQTHLRLGDIDYDDFAALVEDSTDVEPVVPVAPVGDAATSAQSSVAIAKAKAEQMKAEQAAAAAKAAEPVPEPEEPMFIPHFIARGTVAVNSVKYQKNFAENISLKFRVDDSLYVIDEFSLDAIGGKIVTSLLYDTRDTADRIELHNQMFGVDARKLLEDNDDFGMTEDISHNNISGVLTSDVYARVFMRDTTIFYEKIDVQGEVKIENGGLYGLEPIMDMAKFTGMGELDTIIFKTLTTNLFVFNNRIFMPKTDIVSTALDLSAYGMQSFNGDYEYHAVVHPSDVLFGKSANLLKKQGKESDLQTDEDRRGLYLVMMEVGDTKKTGFDTKALQTKMKTTIRVQDQVLNIRFHPKIVNFSTELDRKEYKRKNNSASGQSDGQAQEPGETPSTPIEQPSGEAVIDNGQTLIKDDEER